MERWLERFKALSEETRVVLLSALLDEELSVGELAEVVAAPQPGVSRHLLALSKAGLVASRKEGTATLYRLSLGEPILDGPFRAELARVAQERKLGARIEKVLSRRRAKSVDFFDRVEDWDTLRAELFADTAGLASLLALVPRGLRVADIGTGTGGMLPYLAEVSTDIIAVDLSAEMLRRARKKAEKLGIEGVTFRQGELESLPIETASVDASFAALVLHHAARPAAALREMVRITKPGGAIVLVDLVSHGHEWLRDEQADVWLGFARDEIVALATAAGLANVKHRVVSRAEVRGKGSGAPLELFVLSGRVEEQGRAFRGRPAVATETHGATRKSDPAHGMTRAPSNRTQRNGRNGAKAHEQEHQLQGRGHQPRRVGPQGDRDRREGDARPDGGA